MILATKPRCKNCVHRTIIRVFSDLKHKEEEQYVCVLSYCPFEYDKFDEYNKLRERGVE